MVQVYNVHVIDGKDPISHMQLTTALRRTAFDDAACSKYYLLHNSLGLFMANLSSKGVSPFGLVKTVYVASQKVFIEIKNV